MLRSWEKITKTLISDSILSQNKALNDKITGDKSFLKLPKSKGYPKNDVYQIPHCLPSIPHTGRISPVILHGFLQGHSPLH